MTKYKFKKDYSVYASCQQMSPAMPSFFKKGQIIKGEESEDGRNVYVGGKNLTGFCNTLIPINILTVTGEAPQGQITKSAKNKKLSTSKKIAIGLVIGGLVIGVLKIAKVF